MCFDIDFSAAHPFPTTCCYDCLIVLSVSRFTEIPALQLEKKTHLLSDLNKYNRLPATMECVVFRKSETKLETVLRVFSNHDNNATPTKLLATHFCRKTPTEAAQSEKNRAFILSAQESGETREKPSASKAKERRNESLALIASTYMPRVLYEFARAREEALD